MKKTRWMVWTLLLFYSSALWSQDDSLVVRRDSNNYYQTVYNLRPVTLRKGQMVVNLGMVFPRFYKAYNPMTQSIEKVNPKVVLSESYFNGYFTYGISRKFSAYAVLPFANIRHYSPLMIQSGVGFGDVQLGGVFQLVDAQKHPGHMLSIELKATFPTGKYNKVNPAAGELPVGLGSFRFAPAVNGIHSFQKFDLWYSVYYEYRTNHSGMTAGDETGAYLTLQRSYHTALGEFGLEGGLNGYFNWADTRNGTALPQSQDYSVNLYIGGWYKYLDKFYLRFGVPYSVYQNKAWLTQYKTMIQFDYLIN